LLKGNWKCKKCQKFGWNDYLGTRRFFHSIEKGFGMHSSFCLKDARKWGYRAFWKSENLLVNGQVRDLRLSEEADVSGRKE
jgi:hypothetical protein